MKKFLSLTVLGVSLVSLAACGNSSSKTETKGSLDNEASKVLTVKHGNVRQNFDKIIMANASQEFSGGSNLDSLKGRGTVSTSAAMADFQPKPMPERSAARKCGRTPGR